MKKMILFILFICLASGVFSKDVGTISVTVVSSEYGTGLTKVRYDSSMLSEICATYDVEVKVRFFEGEDFQPIPAEDIEGELKDVAPGVHTLTWDGSASFAGTFSEEAVIRVLATTSRYDLAVAADPASGGTATDQIDEGPYEKEVEVSIQAEANTGYVFSGWQASSGSFDDGDALETTFTMPAVNSTITATFELIDYTLTLLADPTEGGTVSGAGEYNYGNAVQIEASATEGWLFLNWTDDDNDEAEISTEATHSFDMPAGNVNYTANFCQLPGTPEAKPATDITDNSFTANWEQASGADTYTLEMSLSLDFDPTEETIELDDEDLSHTFSVTECGAFTYYYRVKATNACGTSNYSDIISHQHTVEVAFTYNGDFVTYGTVYHHGRCWMDRNLGASRVPKASHDTDGFGDLFQWGRSADGHQKRNSGTIETQSSDSNPSHDDFIIQHPNWYNGSDPHPDDLWQEDGTGINNPCPPGWRVPTRSELDTERDSWESQNVAGAYGSPLKWTAAGERCNMNGDVLNQGSEGSYWSSTARIGYNSSWLLDIKEDNAGTYRTSRASGFSVRCVRDLLPAKDD